MIEIKRHRRRIGSVAEVSADAGERAAGLRGIDGDRHRSMIDIADHLDAHRALHGLLGMKRAGGDWKEKRERMIVQIAMIFERRLARLVEGDFKRAILSDKARAGGAGGAVMPLRGWP